MTIAGVDPCPCGSGMSFAGCCRAYLVGEGAATTAERLMRSRYTAYHQGNVDYLIATHHLIQRYPGQRAAILQSTATTTWLGLRVLSTTAGQATDSQGLVEFVAYYTDSPDSKPGQVHERSRFTRQKDRWLYVDGDELAPLWPRRSDPCWCGSGRKHKACHGH